MKSIQEQVVTTAVIVEEDEALMQLLGKKVTFLCLNYIYVGKLVGVNKTSIKLEDASIVYETGAWDTKSYKDAQQLPTKHLFLNISTIESFGELK
jgi:hypothetical protein